jgi:predicted MFS family arabinose efflux permease
MTSLVSRVGKTDEQGRVQGAASAVESLGRTIGPVWGSASLQRFGDGTPYLSAAVLLVIALVLSIGYDPVDAPVDAPVETLT